MNFNLGFWINESNTQQQYFLLYFAAQRVYTSGAEGGAKKSHQEHQGDGKSRSLPPVAVSITAISTATTIHSTSLAVTANISVQASNKSLQLDKGCQTGLLVSGRKEDNFQIDCTQKLH
ncbi:hypothetical protein TYRP_012388 [Tyrophagus putrescentiae]|nr:hypothetical protein TYRP_012388 [Tyrophagus putrescentiae]